MDIGKNCLPFNRKRSNPHIWDRRNSCVSTLCGTSEPHSVEPRSSRSESAALRGQLLRTRFGGWKWSCSCQRHSSQWLARGTGETGCSPRERAASRGSRGSAGSRSREGAGRRCLGTRCFGSGNTERHIAAPAEAAAQTNWWENDGREHFKHQLFALTSRLWTKGQGSRLLYLVSQGTHLSCQPTKENALTIFN